MLNKWDNALRGLDKYGKTDTYRKGAKFLRDCDVVEDWGCGFGSFKEEWESHRRCLSNTYKGIDGTKTSHSDIHADLTKYVSGCQGIFMRHVLEHNREWGKVLNNACFSFTKKMVLVLFTPFREKTQEISYNINVGVPDISFKKEDITDILNKHNCVYSLEELKTNTQYEIEYVFLISRPIFI